VLVDDLGTTITGILDVGDACVECYALALGNSLFYALLGQLAQDVVPMARELIEGYVRR
jgi:hypothetical protein